MRRTFASYFGVSWFEFRQGSACWNWYVYRYGNETNRCKSKYNSVLLYYERIMPLHVSVTLVTISMEVHYEEWIYRYITKVYDQVHRCKIPNFNNVHYFINFYNISFYPSFVMHLPEDCHKRGWNMQEAYWIYNIKYFCTFMCICCFHYHMQLAQYAVVDYLSFYSIYFVGFWEI